MGRVGCRLEDEKVRQWFEQPHQTAPEVLYRQPYARRRQLDTTVGLDCGYVRKAPTLPPRIS
jgi:hypothetical protein